MLPQLIEQHGGRVGVMGARRGKLTQGGRRSMVCQYTEEKKDMGEGIPAHILWLRAFNARVDQEVLITLAAHYESQDRSSQKDSSNQEVLIRKFGSCW
jgi:hypothetical protein